MTHSFCNYYQSFPSQLRSGTPHWTRARGWSPARHTELAWSQLGSGTPHWTRRIAVEVRHATLNSRDHSWGPARHTELAGSRLGSGTPHWTRRIAVGVRHATLNSRARGWGPARHTELTGSQLRSDEEEDDRRRRRRKEEEGGVQEYRSTGEGEETNIKSNNPHLTGGEKLEQSNHWNSWISTITISKLAFN